MEKTFIMVKPDGVERGLIGEVIQRFEKKGFSMIASKMLRLTKEQAATHYMEHKDKPFMSELVSFITSAPVFMSVWQGEDVIALSRQMIGKTSPLEAQPGTIRGDYSKQTNLNIIHGSDSVESATREIQHFFEEKELVR